MDYTGMYQEILLSYADNERSDRGDDPTLQSTAGEYNVGKFPARTDRQSRGRRRQRTFELWAGAMMRWLHTAAMHSMAISPQPRTQYPADSARPWWTPWRATLVAAPVSVTWSPKRLPECRQTASR
jgi:hypothetical protein